MAVLTFTIEVVFRLIGEGIIINLFDALIVILSYVELLTDFYGLSIFRVFSLLRKSDLWKETVMSIPKVFNVIILSTISLLFFALFAKHFFGEMNPKSFGNTGSSIFSMFLLLLGHNYSKVVEDTMIAKASETWMPVLFFSMFYVIGVMLMNLAKAVLIKQVYEMKE